MAQPPKPPAKQQERDLKLEKIETPLSGAPKAPPSIPRSYAVIVGVSSYQNLPPHFQLQFAERDAQSIHTVLISPEGGNFKAENVHILNGPQATLAALKREIVEWLPSVAKEGDRVLIYFAGHGFIMKGKGYLAPHDFKMENPEATGFPMDLLGSVVGTKIEATSKILLTDSCHSGAISPEDTESINQTLAGLNPSLFSMTASRAREQSFESATLQGGHGVFTYYVVKGMEGQADTDRDGIVTADELAEYVHTEVRHATSGKQNPTSDKGNFDPAMLLAYVPAHADPATPPAAKVGSLMFESDKDDVEVFVDGTSMGVLKKGKNLSVPGLLPGKHTVQGVKMGYEPDGPREETVYPGQDSTVTIKILIPRRRPKAAVDQLEDGIKLYMKGKGDEPSYKKAAEHFEAALRLDATYSQAAYYLGLTYNALYDEQKAELNFKKAIAIDPDYSEAHAVYGGMLLDIGNVDEAIRQFNTVLVRNPNHVEALTNQAQALRFKGLYPQAIDSARKAAKIAPKNAEPHLWIGDCLRLTGKYAEARVEYDEYLKLSNFDTGRAGQLNYWVMGSLFGMGKRKRAATQDIWRDLRSLAYFGICDSQRRLNQIDLAIASCTTSLTYGPKDAYAHYALGLAYMAKAINTGSVAELDPALKHLREMLVINPDMEEAAFAKKNIDGIQKALQGK